MKKASWVVVFCLLLAAVHTIVGAQPASGVVSVEVGDTGDQAQARQRATKRQAYGRRVSMIKIEGYSLGENVLPLKQGDILDRQNLSNAVKVLRSLVRKDVRRIRDLKVDTDFDLKTAGAVGVTLAVQYRIVGVEESKPPAVSVEVGRDWDKDDTRADDEEKKPAHERAKQKDAYSLRVREVRVENFLWNANYQLPLAAGDLLTPQKIFDAMEALQKAITGRQADSFRSKGEVGILYIDVEYDVSPPDGDPNGEKPPGTVGVIFKPYYIGFSLMQVGNNVLPIPRTPKPSFAEDAPATIRLLNPSFAMSYDRAFGTGVGGGIETDILHLPGSASGKELDSRKHLDLRVDGLKAMENLNYRVDAGLRYRFQTDNETLREVYGAADYEGSREPIGSDEQTKNAGRLSGGISMKLGPNTRLFLDLGGSRDDNEVLGANIHDSLTKQVNRVLFDSIPLPNAGFVRAAIWEENGWEDTSSGSYQRLVGRVGYEKEFLVAANQTIGIELLAGAGENFGGAIPVSDRYFGGNSPSQFLYDDPNSDSLLKIPAGPLLRSFGEREAGLASGAGTMVGGNRFWHANLNITLPIRPWSKALIPDEDTDLTDSQGAPVTLRRMLHKQIDVTGPSMLAAVLRQEGLTEAEAAAKANRILSEFKPATGYLIDIANLWSVKPLLMVDVAGMSGPAVNSETWLGVGGGVQVNIVTAKFELGYMQNVVGEDFGHHGNFFARIGFKKLF